LYEFVQQGGTLITEGTTTPIFPNLGLTPGVRMESPSGLFARGTILRGVIADKTSPLMYGYQYNELPIYFSSGSVLSVGPAESTTIADAAAGGRGGRGNPLAANTTPMANRLTLSGWDPARTGTAYGALPVDTTAAGGGRGGRGGGAGAAGGRGAGAAGAPGGAAAPGGRGAGGNGGAAAAGLPGVTADPASKARVVMQFPDRAADMLLSGTLANGEGLQGKAQLVDESVGKGHIVMFAFRPYWRWQTQGTFAIGFNAIMNWNHLDAGK
ncbi:MAG: hypothetical protein ABUL71_03180, partial [Gemmatimonadota bacterium]